MLPYITKLTGLDVYRDGGSLSASFESDDDNEYTLLFKIDSAFLAAEGRRCYKAFLEKYVPTEYKSPVTGDVSPGFRHESEPVTWEEARSLLEQLKPHLEGFISEYFWVFGRMLEVAAGDGK